MWSALARDWQPVRMGGRRRDGQGSTGIDRDRQGQDAIRGGWNRRVFPESYWELTYARGHIPESFAVNFIILGTWKCVNSDLVVILTRTAQVGGCWLLSLELLRRGKIWCLLSLPAYLNCSSRTQRRFIQFIYSFSASQITPSHLSFCPLPGGPWLPMSFWIEFYAMQSSASLGLHCDWKRLGRCRISWTCTDI